MRIAAIILAGSILFAPTHARADVLPVDLSALPQSDADAFRDYMECYYFPWDALNLDAPIRVVVTDISPHAGLATYPPDTTIYLDDDMLSPKYRAWVPQVLAHEWGHVVHFLYLAPNALEDDVAHALTGSRDAFPDLVEAWIGAFEGAYSCHPNDSFTPAQEARLRGVIYPQRFTP